MMVLLYVSTDSRELKALIGENSNYKCTDYDANEGQELVSKLGFNPMSKIELPNQSYLDIISHLVQNGLIVKEVDGIEISTHLPKDYDVKTKLLQCSNYKNRPFSDCIFRYSINPERIDKSHGIPKKNPEDWRNSWVLNF